MSNEPHTDVYLRIKDGAKAMPYGPVDRGDGHPNHGFKDVKGNPEAARKIVEVLDDLPMQEALVRIADPKTAFFTMGCEKSFNPVTGGGFWAKGYIEFSYNYAQAISGAQNYFPLFFHFDQYIKKQRLPSPVLFEWELEGNIYRNGLTGYSCAIWVSTTVCETEAEVRKTWEQAWNLVANHLVNWKAFPELPTLFGPTPLVE